MNAKVDLRQLAVERAAPASTLLPSRPFTRVVAPLLLLSGFAALVLYATWNRVHPPQPVTVMPVISMQASGVQAADAPLFRAAGWVEPRPTPILATALAEGVVESLLVVEGQQVQRGEVLARLTPADARLALEAAVAEVNLRAGELAAAKAALIAARVRLDQPLHLKVEVADAEVALAKAETELGTLPHLLRAAQARQTFAALDWENKKGLATVVAQATINKSKSELDNADATVEELRSRQQRLPLEVAALKAKRDVLLRKLELKTDETRQVGEAEAALQTAEARLAQARTQRDAARLRLERMEVRAPASGTVLALVARPGTRLMGQAPNSLHDASTVLTLYDPASLQVRVDVRLDDVGKVLPQQKVRIETAALPNVILHGEVLTATSQADIQKNTLAVKVAVADPPPALKPEMLCQVTFLGVTEPKKSNSENGTPYRLFVPRQLIDATEQPSRVWLADLANGTATSRPIQTGMTTGDLVEVISGLRTTDRLIVAGRAGLKEGTQIHVIGEDDTLGIAAPGRKGA